MAKIKPKLPYGLNRMFEASLRDIINDSKRTDPQRIIRSQKLTSTYLGMDDGGQFEFKTTSGTTEGKFWYQKIYWSDVHQFEELYTTGGHVEEKTIEELMRGNIRVTCDDYSFLYWAWAYKSWTAKYGLTPETRAPKRNNVKLHGGACFGAGTKVLTESGFKNIEDIKTGDMVYTHLGNLKRVYAVSKRWADNVVSTKIGNEVITCTDNHRFLATSSHHKPVWKELKEFKKSDGFSSPVIKFDNSVVVPDNYAFMLGLFLGDGNIHLREVTALNSKYPIWNGYSLNRLSIACAASRENLYRKKFSSLGFTPTSYNTKPNTNDARFNFSDADLLHFIVEFGGFTFKGEHKKFVHEDVLKWNNSAKLNLLLGFFWADGTLVNGAGVYPYKNYATFYNTNRELLEMLYVVAKSIGIEARFGIDEVRPRFGCSNPKEMFWFKVSGDYVKSFVESDPYLLEMYSNVPKSYSTWSRAWYYDYNINYYKGYRETNPQYVYNMSVEDDESYLVGYNMVSAHNCKHILSVLDLIDSSEEVRKIMCADLDMWLSDVYGVDPADESLENKTNYDTEQTVKVDDTEVSQKNIENTVDDAVEQSVEDITQFFIDIIDGYADMDYDMVEYYNSLDDEEKNTLRKNILSYIDEQDVDIEEENVLQILDLID